MSVRIGVRRKVSDAQLPTKAHPDDAGWDVASAQDDFPLRPGERRAVRTGVALDLPAGYEVQIRPRSGLALKHGITVLNSPSTIDAGYQGELLIVLINHGHEAFEVKKGMRIAQFVPQPVLACEFDEVHGEAGVTDRGAGGFGSSGT